MISRTSLRSENVLFNFLSIHTDNHYACTSCGVDQTFCWYTWQSFFLHFVLANKFEFEFEYFVYITHSVSTFLRGITLADSY